MDARSRDFKDAEAEFLRTADCVTKTAAGSVYIVTAAGRNFGYCSLIPDNKSFGQSLEAKLKMFNALPAQHRAPGAFTVPDKGPSDPKRVAQTPPDGCLIVRVFNRHLARKSPESPGTAVAGIADGLRYTTPADYTPAVRQGAARFAEAANDFLWVTKAEWQALMPAEPRKGQTVAIPASLQLRLLRHHLDPARGFGESENFADAKLDAGKLQLIVEQPLGDTVRMRLEGEVHLKRDRGKGYQQGGLITYTPRLFGYLEFDRAKRAFTRFDIVALGDMTGRPLNENDMGERPGANPLGIAFELVVNPTPANLLFPRGARDNAARYLGAGK